MVYDRSSPDIRSRYRVITCYRWRSPPRAWAGSARPPCRGARCPGRCGTATVVSTCGTGPAASAVASIEEPALFWSGRTPDRICCSTGRDWTWCAWRARAFCSGPHPLTACRGTNAKQTIKKRVNNELCKLPPTGRYRVLAKVCMYAKLGSRQFFSYWLVFIKVTLLYIIHITILHYIEMKYYNCNTLYAHNQCIYYENNWRFWMITFHSMYRIFINSNIEKTCANCKERIIILLNVLTMEVLTKCNPITRSCQ